jgi:uncharacterized iron-regulated membrane protein
MAEKFGRNRSTGELRAEIGRSRERVARDLRGLHYELDFPGKLRRSFREQTVSWLTAAAAVGTLIVLLRVRKKKIYVDAKRDGKRQRKFLEAGFILAASKIAASVLRPVIVDFLKNRLADYAGRSRAERR